MSYIRSSRIRNSDTRESFIPNKHLIFLGQFLGDHDLSNIVHFLIIS